MLWHQDPLFKCYVSKILTDIGERYVPKNYFGILSLFFLCQLNSQSSVKFESLCYALIDMCIAVGASTVLNRFKPVKRSSLAFVVKTFYRSNSWLTRVRILDEPFKKYPTWLVLVGYYLFFVILEWKNQK